VFRSCATTPADRVFRVVAAVIAGSFALSVGQLWCAIPAGICSAFLLIGAITGWCPTQLLRRDRDEPVEQNAFGYAEARQPIDIT